MKTVVLYFPYIIGLKAFLAEEKIRNIAVDPADPFLHTTLSEQQIEKACTRYGAIPQS